LVAITNVGPSHLEFLGTVEDVARAKLELIRASAADVRLIVNADDPILMKEARQLRGDVITFGLTMPADFTVQAIEPDATGVATVRIDGHEFTLTLIGRHQAYNLLAAYAIARTLGYGFLGVDTRTLQLTSAPMRGEIVRKGGLTFFADCYNANPDSIKASLQAFFQAPHQGRRVVVLGDMLELGNHAEGLHREIGRYLATFEFHVAVFVGELSRTTMEEVLAVGERDCPVRYYLSAGECADDLPHYLRDGDFVFVKGSRGVGLEAILSAIDSGERNN
jgi:UDP-N-acetylmuramyl pentapeptide synthase